MALKLKLRTLILSIMSTLAINLKKKKMLMIEESSGWWWDIVVLVLVGRSHDPF